MDRAAKIRELEELRTRVRQLEDELAAADWPPAPEQYTVYNALAGFVLGMIAAATSLLFNVIGALLLPPPPPLQQHPLNLIRVYLTFPLGAGALQLNSGLALAIGCCLYLGTGMLLGILFYLVLTRWLAHASFGLRLAVVSALALALWVINFYAILSWLQPLLFGGRWIVDLIPWWVGALTHLVFGWTLLLVSPLGIFVSHRPQTEAA